MLGLSGVTGSQRLDTLVIANPERDYPWLRHHKNEMAVTRHLARLLETTLQFAREGREGSPIGTIFVLGDRRTPSSHLRQLILNPLKGHTEAEREPAFLIRGRWAGALDLTVLAPSGQRERVAPCVSLCGGIPRGAAGRRICALLSPVRLIGADRAEGSTLEVGDEFAESGRP
jgi:hypothetical protein